MILFPEKLILWAFILSIPLQTRKILYSWNPGQFNEYLNAYLYVTDILIIILIALWFLRTVREKRSSTHVKYAHGRRTRWGTIGAVTCFFFVAAISLKDALNLEVGLYQFFKLGEFLLLFFYFFANAKTVNHRILAGLFVVSGIVQSLWAALQFFIQSDIGLKVLQESPIKTDLPYVANFFVGADKFIRAYGGFPHPNVLAVFLLVSIFSLLFLFLDRDHAGEKTRITGRNAAEQALFAGGFFILLFGLIFTFSRIALVMYLGGTVLFFASLISSRMSRVHYAKAIGSLVITAGISTVILFIIFSPYLNARFRIDSQEEAVVNRVRYGEESAHQIQRSPIFGVGIGNFIPVFKDSSLAQTEEFYQPVHNIYLLVASELGIAGLFFLLSFIGFVLFHGGRTIVASRETILPVLYGTLFILFLVLGFFDHFFWTIQQGRLLFWVIAGLLMGGGSGILTAEQTNKKRTCPSVARRAEEDGESFLIF